MCTKNPQLIIFGIGQFAELLTYYIKEDTNYEIYGYAVDSLYYKCETFLDKKVILFDDAKSYDSKRFKFLLAVGYSNMNHLREKKYIELKELGFDVISYISPKAVVADNVVLGDGNVLLENSYIAPFSMIGNCNIFWSGSNISHHAKIGNNNFIAPSACVAGNVYIGNNCFLGANSTIRNGIEIGDYCLIGSGTNISKNMASYEVNLEEGTKTITKTSLEITI